MLRSGRLRVLPERRSECRGGERPCPYVSCRYHLLLDVARDGRLYITRDVDEDDADSIELELTLMPETCALDVAERGGINGAQIGTLLNTNKQRIEQVLNGALAKIRSDDIEWDEREHPDDPYLRFCNMGADELAEITTTLRQRGKVKR